MTLENILTIIDKFDSSESAYLELQMGEVNLKLKKAEVCCWLLLRISGIPD